MSDKPVVLLSEEIGSPPLSDDARVHAGFLFRLFQEGELVDLPGSRVISAIGANCRELCLIDREKDRTWRIIFRMDTDALLIADVFARKSDRTPPNIIAACKKRFRDFDKVVKG